MTIPPIQNEPAPTPLPPRFVRRFSLACCFVCIVSYVVTGPDKDIHGNDTILTPIQQKIRSISKVATTMSDEDVARVREYQSRHYRQSKN